MSIRRVENFPCVGRGRPPITTIVTLGGAVIATCIALQPRGAQGWRYGLFFLPVYDRLYRRRIARGVTAVFL